MGVRKADLFSAHALHIDLSIEIPDITHRQDSLGSIDHKIRLLIFDRKAIKEQGSDHTVLELQRACLQIASDQLPLLTVITPSQIAYIMYRCFTREPCYASNRPYQTQDRRCEVNPHIIRE